MSTVIYPSPVFGPVKSRRLGISLGINLLPEDGKFCSFDCIYCECGLNAERRAKAPLPTREEVAAALEQQLQQMKRDGQLPDVLTFAGNGEPTLHPAFPDIVDDVRRLRDRYCPEARISVLSNSTQIHREEVRAALLRTDNPIMKLDTVDQDFIRDIDQPQGRYDVEETVRLLAAMSPKVIIQTMFLTAAPDAGNPYVNAGIDNTTDAYVVPWLEAVKRIRPRQAMIYTIDRETPVGGLEKARPEVLNAIAERVRNAGFECSVSY